MADVGARIARGDGRNHQLRHADRKRSHDVRCECRAARASERPYRIEPPLGLQAKDELCRSAAHHLDCRTSIACVGKSLDVCACRGCDLLAGDIGLRQWLAQNPRVDEQDIDVTGSDPVTQERVLATLGVERPDQDDRWPPLGPLVRHHASA